MIKKRIIFLDDEPQTNKKLKRALVNSGYEVVVPSTSDEAFFEINVNGAEVLVHCGHHTKTFWGVCTEIMEKYPQFPSLHIAVGTAAEEFQKNFKGPFHQKLRPLPAEKLFLKQIRKLLFLAGMQRQNYRQSKKIEFYERMESLLESTNLFDFKQKMTLLFMDLFKAKNVLFFDPGEIDSFTNDHKDSDVIEMNKMAQEEHRVIAGRHTTLQEVQSFLAVASKILPSGWQRRRKNYFSFNQKATSFFIVPIAGPSGKKLLGHFIIIDPEHYGERSANSLIPYLQKILGRHMESIISLHYAKGLSYIDDLTDLFNQRYLKLVLEKEINRSQRAGHCFSVLFMDIDHFKRVNDTRGHVVGSKVLVELSKIVHENIRTVDYGFRYGGDEFLMILVGTNSEQARVVAERMRKQVEESVFDIDGVQIKVTLSIGVASFPEHATTKEQIIELADQAMYVGKKRSRNVVYVAS